MNASLRPAGRASTQGSPGGDGTAPRVGAVAAPRRGPLLELAWKLHKLVYRLSGGRLGTRAVGLPVLELTTTGRRSGRPRSVLLNYLDHPDGYVVVASNAGDDRHPAWWLNLEAHPAAKVSRAGTASPVRAEALAGDERDEYWRRAVSANPGYADYESYTDRHIPVVLLRTLLPPTG